MNIKINKNKIKIFLFSEPASDLPVLRNSKGRPQLPKKHNRKESASRASQSRPKRKISECLNPIAITRGPLAEEHPSPKVTAVEETSTESDSDPRNNDASKNVFRLAKKVVTPDHLAKKVVTPDNLVFTDVLITPESDHITAAVKKIKLEKDETPVVQLEEHKTPEPTLPEMKVPVPAVPVPAVPAPPVLGQTTPEQTAPAVTVRIVGTVIEVPLQGE